MKMMMIKGKTPLFGSFDKQDVDFTFLSLLPMKRMSKKIKSDNAISSRNVVVLARLKAHLNFYITSLALPVTGQALL